MADSQQKKDIPVSGPSSRSQPWKEFLLNVLGAAILMFFALYDNYPILNSDSGAYISSGFSLQPPIDRPLFYGLFIRLSSLGVSLWISVFFQCFILAYLLKQFIRKSIPIATGLHIVGIFVFVSMFTIGGWFASQVMPDIFVSILILSLVNFFLFPNTRRDRIYLLGISFIAVLTHNSNFIILTLFIVIIFGLSFFIDSFKVYRAKLIPASVLCVAAWTTLCTVNWLGGLGFTTSRSTHVFVMGKLVESGVLKTYLDKACPIKNYKICKYIDSLPPVAWQFHWDGSSPLQKEGGWDANREEYNTIIRDIFSRPKYYPYMAFKAVEATARQLAGTNIDGWYILPWNKFDEESSPYKAILEHFPHEINEVKISRQNTKTLYIGFFDNLFLIVITTSIFLVLLLLPRTQYNEFFRVFSLVLILMVLNAFATAVLSSVNERFNSSVLWLLPFVNIIFLVKAVRYHFFFKIGEGIE